jgi:alkanesulfonate monooxygenase SsuD/methylene tetrahydromethanopterin reductase-like flavin-dependent oxidoreductase (luciferase family)
VRWGYDHPLGNDFVFSRDFTVTTHSREQALAACAQVPDDVTERVCVWGSPERVAGQLHPYLESGMTDVVWISYSAYANAESAVYFPELVSDVITRLGGEPLDVAALARGGTAIG